MPNNDPTVQLAAHGPGINGFAAFFLVRRRDWQEAFRTLYYSLYDGSTAETISFYSSSVRPRKATQTILWSSTVKQADKTDQPKRQQQQQQQRSITAVISESSRQLRRQLREAGIAFSMPLDPHADARDKREEDAELLAEFGGQPGGFLTKEDTTQPHLSLLLLQGQAAVHGLFDLQLQAWGPYAGNLTVAGHAQDVPLLLSRRPFLHATLRKLEVRFSGAIRGKQQQQQQQLNQHRQQQQQRSRSTGASRNGSNSSSNSINEATASKADKTYVLDMAGPVLPSAVQDMCAAMAQLCTACDAADAADSDDDDDVDDQQQQQQPQPRDESNSSAISDHFVLTLKAEPSTVYLNTACDHACAGYLIQVEGRASSAGAEVSRPACTYDYCTLDPVLQTQSL